MPRTPPRAWGRDKNKIKQHYRGRGRSQARVNAVWDPADMGNAAQVRAAHARMHTRDAAGNPMTYEDYLGGGLGDA